MASDPNYRRVVELAASLTRRGYLVVGGGGLGIMEAANLGAYLADRSERERDDAVRALAESPGYAADPAGYLQVAVGIRERFAPGGESLAIATWMSEGEPISQFASHIAKYFSNSIREDGLLAVATAGIVFAPGDAGTLQEIFQDAAQNAYKVFGRSPMVFLDRQHYCADTGLYPALQRQAERLGFADLLSVGDEPADILAGSPPAARLAAVDTPRRGPDAPAQPPLASSRRRGQEIPARVVLGPAVHDRVDAEFVDGGIEDAVGRGEVEDLQVRAHRLGGERGGHARSPCPRPRACRRGRTRRRPRRPRRRGRR